MSKKRKHDSIDNMFEDTTVTEFNNNIFQCLHNMLCKNISSIVIEYLNIDFTQLFDDVSTQITNKTIQYNKLFEEISILNRKKDAYECNSEAITAKGRDTYIRKYSMYAQRSNKLFINRKRIIY